MADVSLSQEEYPFSFINGVGSLQSIASTEVAFNLWLHKYFSDPPRRSHQASLFLANKFICDDILSVPSRFRDMINSKIEQIRRQLREWIDFLQDAVLFDQDFLGIDSLTVVERFRKLYIVRNWAALEYFFDMLSDNRFTESISFDLDEWVGLLEWCTAADGRRISKLKKSFNIDAIFEEQITYYGTRYESCSERLLAIDEIAMWYFDDYEAEKKFKMRKIRHYKRMPAIWKIFLKKNKSKTVRLLKWFFDYDLTKVRQFQLTSGIRRLSRWKI
ncbi:hypothetical protein U1Q18_044670 [Sarracenia purpurea var. burkii]